MSRGVVRFTLTVAGCVCLTATLAAQTTSTSTQETKSFQVIAVDGNDLVVKLPEGTREITVPEGFKFTVNGQQLSVNELKPGMSGTAVITTTSHVTPVHVTEVKNGTVRSVRGPTIIVQTDEGFRMFTQADADKRGVKMYRNGEPAQISDLREGDRLTATLVTTKPPKVMTEKQVDATLARAEPSSPAPAATSGASARPAPPAPAASREPAAAEAPAHKLPKTGSAQPLVGVAGMLLIGAALGLTAARRRFAR